MASTVLILKRPSSKTSRIICVLRDGKDIYLKFYTRISIKPRHWSKRTQSVLSANPHAILYNRYLKAYRQKIMDIYLDAISKGIKPDQGYIKAKISPQKPDKENEKTFWEIWELYLSAKRNRFAERSIVKYQALANHLRKFEESANKPFHLDNIDSRLLELLQSWFYESAKINTQTTAKYIDILKSFLNWCVRYKYTANTDYKHFTPIQQPDNIKVIVNDTELDLLRNYPAKGYLYNVRQLFLLSCLTGLRYSDYIRIKSEHFKKDDEGNPFLLIRQEKTDEFVEIPLNDEAENITRQLLSREIHPITNQKMNLYVKKICKMACINEEFEVNEYKGKLKTTKTLPKHELVTTHTGRRTFATNLLLKGIPAEIVMQFTGHKDYRSFAKYVNIPKKVQMDAVRKAMIRNAVMKKK